MKKKKRKSPRDQDVAAFWEHHDATETVDLAAKHRVELVFEPPVQAISLRLPVPLLTQIRRIAAHMDIAYQALIKVWLSEKARQESQPLP